MSTSFFDVLMMWLGDGPSSPKYCQMVANASRAVQFGQEIGGAPSDLLELTLGNIGAKVAAPTNALVWHVPDLAGTTLTDEEKAQVRAKWPPLRRLTGANFTPEDGRGDGNLDAILLEVFPSAFRRLEYLFSTLEIPTSMDDWDTPRAATPRWFWIWGFGETGLRDVFREIARIQWEPRAPPAIDRIMKGLAPIYVDAHEVLGTFEDGDRIQVRAFDSTGLPIDPDFVFDTFNRLADNSDFARLKVDHPEAPAIPYQPDNRHVIVISDQQGNPYTPRPAPEFPPPPFDPEAGTVEAERFLLQLSPGTGTYSFPQHGVLVFPAGSGLGGMSGRIGLAMTGTHVRLGTHPNGNLGSTITVDFAPRMFLRLQVLDYRDWFPRNPNPPPRNRLARYSEGNLVTPLIDGAAFFREIFRMIRATYKDIDPLQPPEQFDPDAPADDAPVESTARARIYLSNAWISPHTPLLGRRWLTSTPRAQDIDDESVVDVLSAFGRISFVAAQGVPGLADVAASVPDQLQWWMVSEEGVLPPGACVELRQLIFADDFHGDDPRLPGDMENADLFGIVAPFPGEAASSRAFVGTTGRVVLPVVFAVGREPQTTLRITVWPPGKSEPKTLAFGRIGLPMPSDPFTRPPFTAPVDATKFRLAHEGVPGWVIVVLDAGALEQDQAVVVLNPRSGEAVIEDHTANPGHEIRIGLSGFALQHSALVGFLPVGERSVSDCTHFVELCLGRPFVGEPQNHPGQTAAAALLAGSAPAHPTELAGILREAITAGVDVRVLGWKDPYKKAADQLLSTQGMVNSVNATHAGRRGQAIWDSTSRETFHVHHQKGSFLRTANHGVVAFLGGIDLVPARWDTPAHRHPDPERPSSTWHDVQCKIEGKAVWDVYWNFMQRWNAAHALPDLVGVDPGRTSLPPPDDAAWGPTPVVDDPQITRANGPHAVQIIRTLAPHLEAYGGSTPPFDIVDLNTGDLSVRETWTELLKVADRYIYIEEQYFWILPHAAALNLWLRAKQDRFLFLVIPRRFTDLPVGDQIHYALRRRTLSQLLYGTPDVAPEVDVSTLPGNVEARIAMFHIASDENFDPIYVHSKLVIADDTWFTIGSANLTRRSWTFDSEINAACIDTRLRRGGHVSARQLRVDLLAEHLCLAPVERPLVDDPLVAFRLVKDVLAGKRPWMRTHLLKVDLKFTHYGPFPEGFDPVLRDAVDLVVDTDGTKTNFELNLIDAIGLFKALLDESCDKPFGCLGRLRFTFDVSDFQVAPSEVLVRVEIGDADAMPLRLLSMGPWSATDTVDAGVLDISKNYIIRARALEKASSTPIGRESAQTVSPTDYLTTVNIVLNQA